MKIELFGPVIKEMNTDTGKQKYIPSTKSKNQLNEEDPLYYNLTPWTVSMDESVSIEYYCIQ